MAQLTSVSCGLFLATAAKTPSPYLVIQVLRTLACTHGCECEQQCPCKGKEAPAQRKRRDAFGPFRAKHARRSLAPVCKQLVRSQQCVDENKESCTKSQSSRGQP
jgi:hypothetical protein